MSEKAMYPRAGETHGAVSAGEVSGPVARVVREELSAVREELREEFRAQALRRTVRMRGGAAASALYGGAALAVAAGLLLALVMPGWAAFLIVAAALFALAAALRGAARERPRGTGTANGGAAGTHEAGSAAYGGAPGVPGAPDRRI